jgi:hypothetical protein
MNISLLCKWWRKLEKEEGIWQDIVKKKYMKGKGVNQLTYKANNSAVRNDLLKIKHIYIKGRIMRLGNGLTIDFWHDIWCRAISLKDKFPNLFKICFDQNRLVSDMQKLNWKLKFRRWLDEDLQNQLRMMNDMLFRYKTNDSRDVPVWKWENSGKFSVRSLYKHFHRNSQGVFHEQVWKAKLPLKIKVFMWLTLHAILTKDNLLNRNWKCNHSCAFCLENESVKHLVFECPVSKYLWSILAYAFGVSVRPTSFAQFWTWVTWCLPRGKHFYGVGLAAVCWAIWKTRNAVCFEEKRIKAPTEILCFISSLSFYWAGLQKEGAATQLEQGAEPLKAVAVHFHQKGEMPVEDNRLVVI